MSEEKNDPYITRADCLRISGDIKKDLETIRVALLGKDMHGGLIKYVVMPILIAIIISAITAWILK